MQNLDPQSGAQILQAYLQPWHTSVAEPARAQEEVLHRSCRIMRKLNTANSTAQSIFKTWGITAGHFP